MSKPNHTMVLFAGILVELPLAPFFLKAFRGAACDVNDLPALDSQLHRSLISLKTMNLDQLDALGLTFTTAEPGPHGSQPREVELVPGGRDVPVNADNVTAYVHRVADYKLNRRARGPTAAFIRGLQSLVRPEWLAIFSEGELQALISGAGGAGLDVSDMRAHAQYSGGYHEEHPVVESFWAAVADMSPDQQAALLRFVTSCPRPPLLGFK
jgi:hypothetical protein